MPQGHNEYDFRLIDKYLEAVNAYWSALLTINGLLLTFFSIDALGSKQEYFLLNYFLIGCCAVSLWLLVSNFRAVKLNYYELGTMNIDDIPDVPEELKRAAQTDDDMRRLVYEHSAGWRQENLEKATTRQRRMMQRESVVERLLLVETVLIILILITR